MTAEIKRTTKDNVVDVFFKNEFLGQLIYDKNLKNFGVLVDGESYWDFPTKEKAIGKMLNYYGKA
jgi:hypothetical protein